MAHSSAPLEGVVIIVVDTSENAKRLQRPLAEKGAAVFVAHDEQEIGIALGGVTPHFAVIDPTVAGGTGPQSAAWMFFGHETCRAVVYSSNVHAPEGFTPYWLISKEKPASAVVDAIVAEVRNPNWPRKGGDDLKPHP